MKKGRKNEKFEEECFAGEIDFYTGLLERRRRAGQKRPHPAAKLDDIAFLFDPPAEAEMGEDDSGEWPYGTI